MVDIRPDSGMVRLQHLFPTTEDSMPRTLGGLVGLLVTSVIGTLIGLWIINRVPFLSMIVYGQRTQ